MMTVRGALALCLLVLLVSLLAATRTEAQDLDFDLPNGHFFKQTNGQGGAGNDGFAVTDDDTASFWSEFRRLGGVEVLGYPISRRFGWDGFVVQAFQKAVLQWRPEVGEAYFVNVFDRLSTAGKDAWLEAVRSTPQSFDHSADSGLLWNQVINRHYALLDINPSIKEKYFADSDPIQHFGLPMSYKDYGNVFVVRAQRAVFQQWKEDYPWARAGQVVLANGGAVAMEAGMYPPEAIVPASPGDGPAWLKRMGTQGRVRADSVAVDNLGNVYAVGVNERLTVGWSKTAYLAKYDPAGRELWARQLTAAVYYGGLPGESAYADRSGSGLVVAVDGHGNAYVLASDFLPYKPLDGTISVHKFSADGDEQWLRRVGPIGNNAVGIRLVGGGLDGGGNVYVVGRTFGRASPEKSYYETLNVAAREYNADGQERWTRVMGTGEWQSYWPESASVDGNGNLFVAGSRDVRDPTGNSLLLKVDWRGNDLWARKSSVVDQLSGNESTQSLAADRSGNIYAAGFASVGSPSDARFRSVTAFIRRHDADGKELWMRQFQLVGTDGMLDGTVATAIAVAMSGDVYVAGAAGFPVGESRLDAFVRAYSPNGDLIRTYRFGTPGTDIARAAAVDADGNAYVVGSISSGASQEAFLAKVAHSSLAATDGR